MKKTLTKAMAIFLSLVMLVACVPAVLAMSEYDAIELDEINTVYIEMEHGNVVVTFTPDESGWYVIESDNSNGEDEYDIDPYVEIYDSNDNEIAEDDDDGFGYNFVCKFKAEAGETYYILLYSYDSDVEYNYVISKFIEIIHQPTAAEPYVEISWTANVEYQWYTIESGEEITDENACSAGEGSSYDSEYGWSGSYWDETGASFFAVELEEGDVIFADFGQAVDGEIGIWDMECGEGVWNDYGTESGVICFTAPWDGVFELYAYGINYETLVRAYFSDISKIDGETKADLQNSEIGKIYRCEATLSNGNVLISDAFENIYAITHQPTADEPYVELNDDTDATYQWYTVDGFAEITENNATGSWAVFGAPSNVYGTYDKTTGWSGPLGYFFVVELEEGDLVTFDIPAEVILYYLYTSEEGLIQNNGEVTGSTYTAVEGGYYGFFTDEDRAISLKAYIGEAEYNEIDGATTDTLTPESVGYYVCEVTFADGTTEMSDFVEIPYAITHQPTEAEPYIEVNFDEDETTYQWCVAEEDVEITDKNADTVTYDWGTTSYDAENGWTGVPISEDSRCYDFFTVSLKKGDTVTVELTGDYFDGIGLWDYEEDDGPWIYSTGESAYELTVEWDGDYTFYTYCDPEQEVYVKAYFSNNFTEIDGATTDTLTPEAVDSYVCEVTFADGTTEMSDVFEVTHLHADTDKNHLCDVCRKPLTQHADADNDHICDVCEETISQHTDENGDNVCDKCDGTIHEHVDENGDGICDDCEEVFVFCEKCGEGIHTSFFAKLICEIKAFFAQVADFFVGLFSFDF